MVSNCTQLSAHSVLKGAGPLVPCPPITTATPRYKAKRLKKTSLNFRRLFDPEVIPLIYLGINTVLPGNLLSTEPIL